MNEIFWSNVGVDVETARAAPVAITGISKANPGVVTYGGTVDPVNGAYVVLQVEGMSQVSSRVFRVANVNSTDNTFELDGEDTSDYDTFISGNFQVLTFGASFRSVQEIQVSGGEPEFADLTTIHVGIRRRAPVVVSPMSLVMNNLFDVADPGFVECHKAYKARTQRAIRLRFSNGARMAFAAYASAAGVPTGQAQQVVRTNVNLEAQGLPTVYAS
ncbi:phage tail tube protein [Paracidovorax wautersii]|uniref:phage tail tube protein n=1 Tax=Paracidovorax wautersii TaxID=1177982 RepID=UPI0031DA0729